MTYRLIRYIGVLLLGVTAAGCGDSMDGPAAPLTPDSPGTLTIRLQSTEKTRSAASDKSETLIDDLIIALYPDASDETAPATAVGRFTDLGADGTATVTMILDDKMTAALFNDTDGASCHMYALANLPAESDAKLPDYPSIEEMKKLSVASPFKEKAEQASFVMAGSGSVSYKAGATSREPGSASGKGNLARAASKINLRISLPASITVGPEERRETWYPEQTGIQVLLNNGVDQCVTAPDNDWQPKDGAMYYNSEMGKAESKRELKNNGTGTYSYTMDVPFYTYPNKWTESLLETNKTTMTLIVPWRKDGTDAWVTYYYMVPVTPADLPRIDPNYSYTVNLNVGMLGSLVPEVPFELEPLSYNVVNWSQEDIDVDIQEFRYLVVNPNNITINNEADITIPYYTSHPIDLDDVYITYQRFAFVTATGNADIGKVVEFTIDEEQIDKSNQSSSMEKLLTYEITTDASNQNQKVIKLYHPLNLWTPVRANGTTVNLTGYNSASDTQVETVANQIDHYVPTTEGAYSSYQIVLHIAHKDQPQYEETITITQYPGMYIQADRNPATGTAGNVFVNGYSNGNGELGTLEGLTGNSQNKNPNMYVISISQLSTTDYIIGDPRSTLINNSLTGNGTLNTSTENNNVATWDNAADALYKPLPNGTIPNTRHLAYYYPTVEQTDEQYARMVAPKIRIASSWGVVSTINRQTARRRAATYQEQNKPAGRWRMPTQGELEFIVNLSRSGKIPTLFNPGGTYWTAQGAFTVSRNTTGAALTQSNATSAFVRAVYDEWYWDQFPEYTITAGTNGFTYTLGDMPRGAL